MSVCRVIILLAVLFVFALSSVKVIAQETDPSDQEKVDILNTIPVFNGECPYGCWLGFDLAKLTIEDISAFYEEELDTQMSTLEDTESDTTYVSATFDLSNVARAEERFSSIDTYFTFSGDDPEETTIHLRFTIEEALLWPAYSPANIFDEYGVPTNILVTPGPNFGIWLIYQDQELYVKYSGTGEIFTEGDTVLRNYCFNFEALHSVDIKIYNSERSTNILDAIRPALLTQTPIQEATGLENDEIVERVIEGRDCFEVNTDVWRN